MQKKISRFWERRLWGNAWVVTLIGSCFARQNGWFRLRNHFDLYFSDRDATVGPVLPWALTSTHCPRVLCQVVRAAEYKFRLKKKKKKTVHGWALDLP